MTVKNVLKLQDEELKLTNLERTIKTLEKDKQNILLSIGALKKERENLLSQIKLLEKQIKDVEENIQICKNRIKKAEKNLALVRRAEDYKRVIKEKAQNENYVLKLSKDLEDLRKKRENLEKDFQRVSKSIDKKLERLNFELQDLDKDIERIREEIKETQDKIKHLKEVMDQREISQYEQLKSQVGLPVIVKVDSFRACSGCGTVLPVALYLDLISGKLVRCPNCERFVYYEA